MAAGVLAWLADVVMKSNPPIAQVLPCSVLHAKESTHFGEGWAHLDWTAPPPLMCLQGNVFDFVFDKAVCTWRHWMAESSTGSSEGGALIPSTTPFNEIIVPTIDTVRYGALLALLLRHGKHALVLGPTGTGKTVYIQAALAQLGGSYMSIATAFSAQTTCNQVRWWQGGKGREGCQQEGGRRHGSSCMHCGACWRTAAAEQGLPLQRPRTTC